MHAAANSDKTLRIDADVLNRMMNLVGELVLTRNQMLQSGVESTNFPELARRRADVFRVLDNCSGEELKATTECINTNRPDLTIEVTSSLSDINVERQRLEER
ncbi:hypothetical protein [Edaphobacter aggregans]|uniref:hypothetical protein n=1 Tax=Edaphobacter aggregans TaxID=570835 RepID=UPI001FE12FF9|nr:hypothetical protein [Edaphobacter aggregans]